MTEFTLKSAQEAGKIGTRNTKMPGSTFALPPSMCQTGGKLAEIPGSVCSRCYAAKLEKLRPSVRTGWGRNYLAATALIERFPDRWAKALAFQILHSKNPEHRWFDGGDLQSYEMLKAIALVATLTPDVRHWLPTKEARFVTRYLREFGDFPANLTVRVSAPMIDQKPVNFPNTSTVNRHGSPFEGWKCPAYTEAHRAMDPDRRPNCGPCRACWDREIRNVSYDLH